MTKYVVLIRADKNVVAIYPPAPPPKVIIAIPNVGPRGPQGRVGAQGPQGDVGAQGDVGPQGATGIGAQGSQGDTGVSGPQGVQGAVGSTGPQGFQGNQGSQGDVGIQGPQGALGIGAQGPQGVQGAGSQGPQGDAGPQGVQGTPGDLVGPQGPQGAQGTPGGPQGPQGVQGVAGGGPQGPQGTSGKFTISSTPPSGALPGDVWWDSDSGSTYILYDDGTSVQWVSFVGAPGPQGAPGVGGGGGSVGGTNTQVQFNDNGVFGGSDKLTFDPSGTGHFSVSAGTGFTGYTGLLGGVGVFGFPIEMISFDFIRGVVLACDGFGLLDLQSPMAVPGAYTLANSGIVVSDQAGVEIFRIWGTDPNAATNYNSQNLYIGCGAGKNQPTDNVDAGYCNTGIGGGVLANITTGNTNIAIGQETMGLSSTAMLEVALGWNTLNHSNGMMNVGIGMLVMYASTSAVSNTALGGMALAALVDGAHNVAVGAGAGLGTVFDITELEQLRTGQPIPLAPEDMQSLHDSYMTFVGALSSRAEGIPLDPMTNAIALGYDTKVGASNTAVIGNAAVTDVYFGSTAGNAAIHAKNLILLPGSAAVPSLTFGVADTGLFSTGGSILDWSCAGSTVMRVSPGGLFVLTANFQLSSTGEFGWGAGVAGTGPSDTGIARNAAGVVEINNGTAGQYRDLQLRRTLIAPTTLGTVTDGALEYDGAKAWFTIGSTRHQVAPAAAAASGIKPYTNRWLPIWPCGTGGTTMNPSAGAVFAVRSIIATTIKTVCFYVQGGSAVNIKIAIYDDSAYPFPGALLYLSAALDCSVSGFKSFTVTVAPGTYWFAIHNVSAAGAPTVRSNTVMNPFSPGFITQADTTSAMNCNAITIGAQGSVTPTTWPAGQGADAPAPVFQVQGA